MSNGSTEVVLGAEVSGRLYTCSSATGGALSKQRITLLQGTAASAKVELFSVVSGAAQLLVDESVMPADKGDPSGLMRCSDHARLNANGAN